MEAHAMPVTATMARATTARPRVIALAFTVIMDAILHPHALAGPLTGAAPLMTVNRGCEGWGMSPSDRLIEDVPGEQPIAGTGFEQMESQPCQALVHGHAIGPDGHFALERHVLAGHRPLLMVLEHLGHALGLDRFECGFFPAWACAPSRPASWRAARGRGRAGNIYRFVAQS